MKVIDGRAMFPPEPFERTLEALAELAPGEALKLIVNCQPRPLYRVLEQNGYAWTEQMFPDGRCEIVIREKSPRS